MIIQELIEVLEAYGQETKVDFISSDANSNYDVEPAFNYNKEDNLLEIDCHLPDFNFENLEDSEENENLAYENKQMGDFLEALGLSVEDISNLVIIGDKQQREKALKKVKQVPVIYPNRSDAQVPLEKAESSKIAQILEIELDSLDDDVFSLLELLNSDKIISIVDFMDYDTEAFYGEDIASKWNQFRNFVRQSGVKYITLVKDGEILKG